MSNERRPRAPLCRFSSSGAPSPAAASPALASLAEVDARLLEHLDHQVGCALVERDRAIAVDLDEQRVIARTARSPVAVVAKLTSRCKGSRSGGALDGPQRFVQIGGICSQRCRAPAQP